MRKINDCQVKTSVWNVKIIRWDDNLIGWTFENQFIDSNFKVWKLWVGNRSIRWDIFVCGDTYTKSGGDWTKMNLKMEVFTLRFDNLISNVWNWIRFDFKIGKTLHTILERLHHCQVTNFNTSSLFSFGMRNVSVITDQHTNLQHTRSRYNLQDQDTTYKINIQIFLTSSSLFQKDGGRSLTLISIFVSYELKSKSDNLCSTWAGAIF